MTPEMIREFEKAGKAIAKLRGNEIIFDDEPGRQHFVYLAMNNDEETLNREIAEIAAAPEGMRHIMRALNNIRTIGHAGAFCFALCLYEALEPTFEDAGAKLQKWIQIVDGIAPIYRGDMGRICEKSSQYLASDAFSGAQKTDIWLHWCGAMLRANDLSGLFIGTVGATRPKDLNRSAVNQLKEMIRDPKMRWDLRSAAVYLLLGNRVISLETAQTFVEEAYVGFPLDALEGTETLAIAVEHDAAVCAEADAIAEKLAQLRREGLVLRDMKHNDLFEASCAVFEKLGDIAKEPITIAMHLNDWGKRERMIVSVFADETRKADWLRIASKSTENLRKMSIIFFEHFDASNPILRQFAADLAGADVELLNADALKADAFIALCAEGSDEAVSAEAKQWAEMLKNA